MKKPDFFIVGAPRCGTTAMCAYLREHPDIYVPENKEPCFFGSDLIRLNRPVMDEGEYLALFAEGKGLLCGEGSTWYLLSELAAHEIHEHNPNAKIIIQVRSPFEVLQSAHKQGLNNGFEDIENIEQALDAEPDRRAGKRIPRSCTMADTLFYSNLVRYTANVQRYRDVFEPENIRIIVYDDIRADTAQVYRETLEFLGVDTTFVTDFAPVNVNKQLLSARFQRFIKAPPKWISSLGKFVPDRAVRGLQKSLYYVNTRYNEREPLDPEVARRLKKKYAPEVERLSDLLGRDLTHWSRG